MKPSLPKGTRDFGTTVTTRRQYIINTIRQVLGLYGYAPIETPALENLSTLTGKYGDEGDKLIFKVLNSGDFTEGVDMALDARKLAPLLAEKALRYDLTVPFARFVVMNRNDITFPFKRYQVQPVWRADRPQKGRYREFYQFDADVVGSNSLQYEAEFFQIFAQVFKALGVGVTIKYNNRKILNGIAEAAGADDKFTELVTIIDKLDKIGAEKMNEELSTLGLSNNNITKLNTLLKATGSNTERLAAIKSAIFPSYEGLKGVEELNTIHTYLTDSGFDDSVAEFDPALARGLSYYTGTIYEVKAHNVQIGSICGGGRYDNLTGLFGLEGVSGVGISFGIDRIYDVLDELKLFPQQTANAPIVLLTNMGEAEGRFAFALCTRLRNEGIAAECYPEPKKLNKQFEYAEKLGIPYLAIIGNDEMQTGMFTLKNIVTGSQNKHSFTDLVGALKA